MTRLAGWTGVAAAAAVLWLASIVIYWPGFMTFDTVSQYRQASSGTYLDWHPPVMARLWSLFLPIAPGQGSMLVVQAGLYWLGLGTLSAAVANAGHRRGAIAVLATGTWPAFLAWEGVVLKDGQMASALLAAAGLAAWPLLAGERPRRWRLAGCAVLLGYATLLRANAVFATVPLAVALWRPWSWRRWPSRTGLIVAGTAAVLAITPAINHGVLGARGSGVELTQPIFDMAGIVRRVGPEAVPLVPARIWRAMIARRCATPVLWDPLSGDRRCGFVQEALRGKSMRAIVAAWTSAIAVHPLAYGAHRAAHWNATMRWLLPWRFPLAIPPRAAEPDIGGLGFPGPAAVALTWPAGWIARSPLGAPIVFLAAAVLILARADRHRAHALSAALALSAIVMEAGFFLVRISSDWRYHLWSMMASVLAVILLLTRPPARRPTAAAAAAVLLIAASVLAARLFLPSVGDDYASALTAYA